MGSPVKSACRCGLVRTSLSSVAGLRAVSSLSSPCTTSFDDIAWDNRAGRFLFAFTHIFQHHQWLTLPHLRSIAAEQELPRPERFHSRLLWGMFTGTHPYRDLLAMACRPALHVRLLRHLVRETPTEHRDQPPTTRFSTLATDADADLRAYN